MSADPKDAVIAVLLRMMPGNTIGTLKPGQIYGITLSEYMVGMNIDVTCEVEQTPTGDWRVYVQRPRAEGIYGVIQAVALARHEQQQAMERAAFGDDL